MLELCARGEKQTCEKGGNPKQRCQAPTYKLNLRVLCPNHFTGKEKHLSGLRSSSSRFRIFFFFFFFPFFSGDATHVNTMGWTYKYCTVLNKMLCEATCSRSDKTTLRLFIYLFFIGRRHARSLPLRVEGKMALNATTSLQNKLFFATYW